MIIFETQRLLVRHYEAEDEESFFRLNSDPVVVRYIRKPKDRKECQIFLSEIRQAYRTHPGMGRFALLERQTAIMLGSFAVFPLEHSPDIQLGYALFPDQWGKGYATEVLQGGIDYAFGKLGLSSVVAIAEIENSASRRVLEKCGFREEIRYMEGNKELLLFRLNIEGS